MIGVGDEVLFTINLEDCDDICWSVVKGPGRFTDQGVFTSDTPGFVTVSVFCGSSFSAKLSFAVHSNNAAQLPKALTRIDEQAFMNSIIEEFRLPDGITSIGSRAFSGCSTLLVCVPDSVDDIADDAFADSATICIVCEKDSYAERYAKMHGVKYVTE